MRDWILEMCTSSNVDQSMPAASAARGTLFEGLYASPRETCIVTGFPVHAVDMLQTNGSVANKVCQFYSETFDKMHLSTKNKKHGLCDLEISARLEYICRQDEARSLDRSH